MPLRGFNHDVRWGQFQKRSSPPNGVSTDARTRTQCDLDYTLSQNRDGSFQVTSLEIQISVNSNESWVVRAKTTKELLRHEQVHYDIRALGAREQFTLLTNLREASLKDLEGRINEIGRDIQRKVDGMNIRYDNQTNHSRNVAQQRHWNTRIRAVKSQSAGTLDLLP
jgi:uncharacterized protein DUF922